MEKKEHFITIPPGSMINHGMHEDDEPFIAQTEIRAKIVGRKHHGAYPIEINGVDEGILYFHQPEPTKKKSA